METYCEDEGQQAYDSVTKKVKATGWKKEI